MSATSESDQLRAERDAATAGYAAAMERCVALDRALRRFVEGYPDGEWRGLLHEEGCIGVSCRPDEREEEWPCKCDGDDSAELIDAALTSQPPPRDRTGAMRTVLGRIHAILLWEQEEDARHGPQPDFPTLEEIGTALLDVPEESPPPPRDRTGELVAMVERLVKRLDSIPGRGGMSRDGVIVSVDHDLIADARALLEKTKGEK